MSMIAMGECMIEVSGSFGGNARLGFAGDSFNTALYMARLGCDIFYATALGDDPWSHQMRSYWAAEDIGLDHVLTVSGKLPGLYAITTDSNGERSFSYWRKDSAVREFFVTPGADAVMDAIADTSLFYTSGITLSLFDARARARLRDAAAKAKANGGVVAFDPNYRPAGWTDSETAKSAIMDFAQAATVILPTFDDEHMLFGDADVDATIDRWKAAGVSEIIVKCGTEDVQFETAGKRGKVSVNAVAAVDTTGAGDSFNAGYLAARMQGVDTVSAIKAGADLSAHVVQYRGAITPRPDFDLFVKDNAA